jgi:hypothetical protein
LKKSAQNKLHQRKQAKFQWFQNPSKTNWDDVKKVHV